MMYFAILGKTPQLSLAELALVQPRALEHQGQIVSMDIDQANVPKLAKLGGIVKRGVYIEQDDFGDIVAPGDLVGTNDKTVGMRCKKLHDAKRFKELALDGADLEVKTEGVEILSLGDNKRGHVLGRQDIDLFAAIDFDKPVRGMQVGMMPAKLTQLLLHIGLADISDAEDIPTVWDPFCGFGTTGFVANALGYHFIGSDINITPTKQNQKRRSTTSYARDDRYMTLFKHDVTDPFTKPFLDQVDTIVTEGRLGPVMTREKVQDTPAQREHIEDIVAVYRDFLGQVRDVFIDKPLIMTVPVYDWLGDVIEQRISIHAEHIGREVTPVGEVYQRKKQFVGRRVLSLRYPGE